MKKTLRILTAMVLTVFMVMSVSMTAFAADTYSIIMKRAPKDRAAHTYEAYQVFKGDISDGKMINITWGEGVNGADLLDALKDDEYADHAAFAGCNSAADVAAVLAQDAEPDNDAAKNFAAIVNDYLVAAKKKTGTIEKGGTDNSTAVISGLGSGYYFVKDGADPTLDGEENSNYTRYILKVVEDVHVTAKAEIPTLDKKIVDGNTEKNANSVNIGDTVNFRITTAVPAKANEYKDHYQFIINDKLCEGLTFDPTSLKVYIGTAATAAEASNYEVLTGNDAAPYTFRVVLKNAKTHAGKAVKVEYGAVLNEKAKLTDEGNENTANLTYSNDPNYTYDGDKPEGGDPTGVTPEVQTLTYTTGLRLLKVDGETNDALKGAKFTISGNGVSAVMVNGEIFKEDENGTYYMLKGGSFTTEEPESATDERYDDTSKKYSKINVVEKNTKNENINKSAYTGNNGLITFVGLGAGTYTITEDIAPEGYNKIAQFTVTISAEFDDAGVCTWTVKKGSETLSSSEDGDPLLNLYDLTVENNQGIVLPGTGGMGTTIFYVVGGLLIVCAGALLITKIRMGQKDK